MEAATTEWETVGTSKMPLPTHPLTFAEYMAIEHKSQTKHHFEFGRMIEVAGASYEHNLLSSNVMTALRIALKGTDCRSMGGDMKIYVSENVGYYPDVCVQCGPALITYKEVLQNPILIAEVLSSSTEAFDRGRKFKQYRTIESLQHILFVEQSHASVEHYERNDAGEWLLRGEYDQLAQSVALTIDGNSITLPLSDIYEFVTFADASASAGESTDAQENETD